MVERIEELRFLLGEVGRIEVPDDHPQADQYEAAFRRAAMVVDELAALAAAPGKAETAKTRQIGRSVPEGWSNPGPVAGGESAEEEAKRLETLYPKPSGWQL